MKDPGSATTDAAAPNVVPPAFTAGALIADRYRLEVRLGAGGGGTVWRAVDEKLGATVAFKIIGTEGELERWRREVAMARRIADRNVCRVHDLGEAEGMRYVTMELVDGKGLRSLIEHGIGAEQARDLFAQIVSGAAAIHAAGIVHRDLKPENIVVASDGRAVIVDFGLAREPRAPVDSNVTHEGAIVGTPRYMSPEQAAGRAVDARSDVWSIGLVGYELLTGALPPGAADGWSRIVEPSALAKWPAIAPVLRRCLALSPEDRYADASALRRAIPRRARSRRPWIAAAVLALVAGGATAIALSSGAEAPLRPVAITQLAGNAFSVTISPDAREYAYTTPDGKLFVEPIERGRAVEWKLPGELAIVTAWAIGWLDDRSLVLIAITQAGTWNLVRVYEDGRHRVLYTSTERFTATGRGRHAAIGVHENAVYVLDVERPDDIEQVVTLGTGETVMALSLSPDGKRVAVARLPPGDADALFQVMTVGGEDVRAIWRGRVTNDVDQIIAWLDDDRVAFVHRGDTAKLYTYSLRSKQLRERHTWARDEYAGIGSAANGELLVLGGRITRLVATGPSARDLRPIHAGSTAWPAGWLPDGRFVYALDDRVVRGTPGAAPERWPGLAGGEIPNTVVGDSVIVHRVDAGTTIVERVDRDGARTELRRMTAEAARYFVRCAGDRAAPCFIEETSNTHVTWRQLDPQTGALGRVWLKRLRRERNMQTAALDATTLAMVEGTSELFLVDLATGTTRTIDLGTGVELQTVSFGADGALWATAVGYRGHFFAALQFPRTDGRLADEPIDLAHGGSRFYWRLTPSPDGAHVAVQLLEFDLVISRITGA